MSTLAGLYHIRLIRCHGYYLFHRLIVSVSPQLSAVHSDSSVHVIALISATDMAAMLSIPLSASVSSGCGSAVGLRDNASGALFRVPFIQLAVNAYPMILVFRLCSRGFWISSNLWLFKMGISGWWSVMTK